MLISEKNQLLKFVIATIFVMFMKKFILSIVTVCYFVVTCGVVINFHYCMDRLASTTFFVSEGKKCSRCGMDIHDSDGCCRDEVQIVKLDEDQQKTTIASYDFAMIDALPVIPSGFLLAKTYNINEQRHFHNHSPPLLSAQNTYLQINVFRI